jgi:hypothetical protein
MTKLRYNCYWVVSFLPTRTEVMINDRETGTTAFQDLNATIDNNFTAVEEYLDAKGVTIFNYECFEHRNITNFLGKGVLSDIFKTQPVRDIV